MVERDFGCAVEANRNTGRARAYGSVAVHRMVLPRPGAQAPWKDRIQRDGVTAGKADLPTMGMPGEQKIEIRVRGLPVDLRRV